MRISRVSLTVATMAYSFIFVRRETEREESGKCDKLQRTENFSKCLESKCSNKGVEEERLVPVAEEEEDAVKDVVDVPEMTESLTSSLSTPDTVVGAARMASPLRLRTDNSTGISFLFY